LICVDRQPIPDCFLIARGAPVRGWLGRMPLSALVVGRHERFSAQTPRGFDSLSVTTSPTWGIAALSAAATGYPVKAKQPLGGMLIAVIARTSELSTQK
jgi:hypothetical protein